MRTLFPILALLLAAAPAWAQQTQQRVLTLEEALRTARERQPQLRQAQANTSAASARVDQNFSSLLPQVSASASYNRSFSNKGAGVGTTTPSGFISREGFNVGASLNQLIWDFGRTTGRWHSSQQSAEAQKATESQTLINVQANVQAAYFNALAQQVLVQVAQETLENEKAHLAQVQAQVQVGTRPEIDLLQQRTAVANAQVQLIQARNNAATSKAQLNQAMGVEATTGYTVQEETVGVVQGEDQSVDTLVDAAFQGRPDLAANEHQLRAQELTISATRGNYWPSLSASVSATDSGPNPANLDWGVSGQVGLSWPLFQGGLTRAQVREQQANLNSIQAQRDALRQQVRLEVERAQLAVTAARESLSAAEEALTNARERLRLAEGRYRAGVGNIIELSDAQLSATNAAVQRVQASYNLATARTELARALGRQTPPSA
ncbi:TolC family protein [Vitiosangium sp. GDMCC 1.1324]|uniref:TolC family protein n=1 Tax=Vitiosangium sp. (strain GDMCC 1.1324) TaxID=2138576 RepID=UPI000D390204|nr:TolC family protein [Vitiosangium sp. GDMCC 1.1324]PTL84190.1 TolC family protein [Vitiosangium sp. GDMCC 1.1324]